MMDVDVVNVATGETVVRRQARPGDAEVQHPMSDPEQMSLLDQAQHRADVAVETVESHMTEEQRDWWIGVVWETARKYQEFSTNAVIEMERKLAKRATEGGETYPVNLIERRALGAVMRQAQKLGIVRPTDRFEPDRTPGAHARPKRIWRSLVWRG